jgi:hypothetical protein
MKPKLKKTSIRAVGSGDLLEPITPQYQNGDAGMELSLLLGTEVPNRQGDTPSLSLARELRMQADCPDCLEMALKAHTYLIRQKYQKILSQWKESGCPDPGPWPDLHTDLFLVSYLRMASLVSNAQAEPQPEKPRT